MPKFTNKRGIEIHLNVWGDKENAKAGILLLHGYAEHGGRYDAVARKWVQEGSYVIAPDHEGHGKSSGIKGDVKGLLYLKRDAEDVFENQFSDFGDRPVFLFGHSMGGALAILLASHLKNKFSGVMLSAPLIELASNEPKWLISLGTMLASAFPTIPVKKLETDALSRDPESIVRYKNDPLIYTGLVRARTGIELLKSSELISRADFPDDIPVWMGHGTADRITSFGASDRFFKSLTNKDKTFKTYGGYFHELLHEPEKAVVAGDMTYWLKARMKKPELEA